MIDIKNSIQKYIDNFPESRSEKLNEFGLSKDGRIVKIGDSESNNTSFKDQLNTTLKNSNNKFILSRNCTLSEACSELENQDNTHRLIQKKLNHLKEKYKKEYRRIDEVMNTKIVEDDNEVNSMSETKKEKRNKFGYSVFSNTLAPERWTFYANYKPKKINKKEFFMSNMVAIQFEKTFYEKNWPLEFPKEIKRSNIVNEDTDKLILSYIDRHDSDEFMQDYLRNTVNGKSTVQVAQDFDLEVYKLSVSQGDVPRDPEDIDANTALPKNYYDVLAYVRPIS